ncbi:MAG TPA: hypothetical protein VIL27_01830, partial [Clostridia bacterium]
LLKGYSRQGALHRFLFHLDSKAEKHAEPVGPGWAFHAHIKGKAKPVSWRTRSQANRISQIFHFERK